MLTEQRITAMVSQVVRRSLADDYTKEEIDLLASRLCPAVVQLFRQATAPNIDAVIADVLAEHSNIARIRYHECPDHDGDPAIFFCVLLKEYLPKIINESIKAASWKIHMALKSDRHFYFNYRTIAEQEQNPDSDYE